MITIETTEGLMRIKGPGLCSYGIVFAIDSIIGAHYGGSEEQGYFLEVGRLVGTSILTSTALVHPTDSHHVVRLFTHAWAEARRGFHGLYATAHGEYFERTEGALCTHSQFWPAEILLPPTEHDTMKQPEEPSK